MKAKIFAAALCTCALTIVMTLCACQQEMPVEDTIDETTAFEGLDDQGTENQDASMPEKTESDADQGTQAEDDSEKDSTEDAEKTENPEEAEQTEADEGEEADSDDSADANSDVDLEAMRAELNITEDYRDSFIHGPKGAEYQRYIMLHDTEGNGDGLSVVSGWDSAGVGVAAHFVVNTDGSIVQCVDLDTITHHAGFGDAGHNDLYGVPEDGRDDRVGTQPIGDWAPDYGMNSYSIGIEMVHVGGSGYYPEEQLAAVDNLIAYIDAYYGGDGGAIIDHKAWRTGNSDTSPEFAEYLANYQDHRTHD